MKPVEKQRMAWALTGSGHYLRECIAIFNKLEDVDLFLSKAAAEILQQYGYKHNAGKVYQKWCSMGTCVVHHKKFQI